MPYSNIVLHISGTNLYGDLEVRGFATRFSAEEAAPYFVDAVKKLYADCDPEVTYRIKTETRTAVLEVKPMPTVAPI